MSVADFASQLVGQDYTKLPKPGSRMHWCKGVAGSDSCGTDEDEEEEIQGCLRRNCSLRFNSVRRFSVCGLISEYSTDVSLTTES